MTVERAYAGNDSIRGR